MLGPYVCVLGVLRLCEHVNVYEENLVETRVTECVSVCVCEREKQRDVHRD